MTCIFGADSFKILGLPDNKDMEAVFKHEMNDVPVDNILAWLTETDRTDLRDRIIQIDEEITVRNRCRKTHFHHVQFSSLKCTAVFKLMIQKLRTFIISVLN